MRIEEIQGIKGFSSYVKAINEKLLIIILEIERDLCVSAQNSLWDLHNFSKFRQRQLAMKNLTGDSRQREAEKYFEWITIRYVTASCWKSMRG